MKSTARAAASRSAWCRRGPSVLRLLDRCVASTVWIRSIAAVFRVTVWTQNVDFIDEASACSTTHAMFSKPPVG